MTETFGDALKRRRTEHGLSLRALQKLTSYSAGYLGELERGTKKPTITVAEHCDRALRAGGQLTALVAAFVPRLMHHVDLPGDDGIREIPVREFEMTADESALFIRRAGMAPTAEVIDQLSTEVRALAVDFLRKPPYAVFTPISARRREVFAMLDGIVRPELLSDLYLVAGQLTALLAHASADLGQPFAAEAHARTAWMCADLAGNNPLRAYVRWIQSNIFYWTGDYISAAETAHQGEAYATSGTGMIRLASQQARAWAALGDGRAVQNALTAAEHARDTFIPDPTEVGVFMFNPGKSAYYAAEAWLALGGQSEDTAGCAITDASEAISLLTGETQPSPELVAAARLDLAAAHIATADIDAAHEVLPAVFELPTERRTVPVVERTAKIGRALSRHPLAESRLSRELCERIALFIAYPATRELAA